MRVLVTGAAGAVRNGLTPAPVARGHDVVALARGEASDDVPTDVGVVERDLLERGSFGAALDGVDVRDERATESFADGGVV